MLTSEALWLLTAYVLGTIASFFLFRMVYTNFITGQVISTLEHEGLIRVEKNEETGDLDVKPAGLNYEEFLERLAEDLEEEAKGEDRL